MKSIKITSIFLACGALLLTAMAELLFLFLPVRFLIDISPSERSVDLKSGNLSANFSGGRSILADDIHFRTNGHGWIYLAEESPRLKRQGLIVEVLNDEMVPGKNLVELRVASIFGNERIIDFSFDYEPEEIKLPKNLVWSEDIVEAQDGQWETIETPNGWRLRPVPGTEGYDRLVLLSPPFAAGRGVSVDVTFRSNLKVSNLFGFGIIPLWGGHNDEEAVSPRRGWEYGISWFYSREPGIGTEFSQKLGDQPHLTSSVYYPSEVRAGETYSITSEAWPVETPSGAHSHYTMRMKWSNASGTQSEDWIKMTDKGSPLPKKDYAIALVAHRSQVEFGAVRIYTVP